jgi:hypothetical protein
LLRRVTQTTTTAVPLWLIPAFLHDRSTKKQQTINNRSI